MLSGKKIILGVTGGIAAYKAAFLLRDLQKAGAEVRVAMTPAATRFLGVETFAALSRHEVPVDIFPSQAKATSRWTRHIEWGEWADLFVIAPCTANTLAKIVHGLSDNMVTATLLAARCPILVCPTMDGEMYQAPATQKNLALLQQYGYHLLEPEEGFLASGLEGKGRLPETNTILKKCRSLFENIQGPLSGKKVLVTAGPTREHLDPVRFISNPSSGKMGFAMAQAAQALGAEVTLLHGPVAIEPPKGIEVLPFKTTADLFELVQQHAKADVVIMAAAVSDFTPTKYFDHKIKKEEAENSIPLQPTQDILAWLGQHKLKDQILIGFAMETEELVQNAAQKRKKKNTDWIIANSLTEEGAGFAADTNTVHLLGADRQTTFSGTKAEVARKVLGHIFEK